MALVHAARTRLMDQCMRSKGFSYPSRDPAQTSSAGYSMAATGDDGTAARPPQGRTVQLPNGRSTVVGLSWSPESCWYRAYSNLGVGPFEREALRMEIMALQASADTAVAGSAQMRAARDEVAKCRGEKVEPSAVLGALDPPPPGLSAADLRRTGHGDPCMGGPAVATLASERSKAEYAVALREPLVVAAWAEVLHAETAAARLSRP